MSSVNTKLEGLRRVLSPKKSAVFTKNVFFREEISDHHKKYDGDSDDETHVLVSHHVDVEHIFDTSQEPFFSDLMKRKAFVQVAFSIVCPKDEGQVCSSATRNERGDWNVSVQAGADPAMMLCLTVVLGEFIR